ncbi:MAG TPA: cupin domain-containing protein [Chloroflexia bacterium]|nr:cupin domain-containing protein [Chloroflexia bacterium]
MNRARMLAVMLALLAPLPFAGALNALAAPAAQEGPSVSFEGTFPLTVEAGDYDLVYLVLDFAPGAGIPLHFHGGPALVVGMEGELTLLPEGGTERKLMPGDVVNETARVQHTMTNKSAANTRILAVILLPKGQDVTTVLDTASTVSGPTLANEGAFPLAGVTAGEYDLVNLVLDFAPGAQIPLHFHGGPAVVVGKEGELTLRPEGGMEHKVTPGMVVNERAGVRHVMINVSSANAAIFAGLLVPKGAEITTLVAQAAPEAAAATEPAGMPRTGGGGPGEWLWLAALLLAAGAVTSLTYAARGRRSGI